MCKKIALYQYANLKVNSQKLVMGRCVTSLMNVLLPRIELVNDGFESDDSKKSRSKSKDPSQTQNNENNQGLGARRVKQRTLRLSRRHCTALTVSVCLVVLI